MPLEPRERVPTLAVEAVGGGRRSRAGRQSEHFAMIEFVLSKNCPARGEARLPGPSDPRN